MFEVRVLCDICGVQGQVAAEFLLNVNPLFRELSMQLLCKTSTYAHKINPTQTLTIPIRGITQVSPAAITAPFHPAPLSLKLLVFNTAPLQPTFSTTSSTKIQSGESYGVLHSDLN